MAKNQAKVDAALLELRAFGLAYPGAHLKSPWPDHCDLAVNDKTFAYMSPEGQAFGISCKLPESSAVALMLPNTSPTAYGLGKSGWVTAQCAPGEVPQVALFKAWIDESYRAQAPKKLIKLLAASATNAPAAMVGKKRTQPARKSGGVGSRKRASKR
jgi:predicted DNA-binding protein (MmcQ/YjbR family)